MKAGFPKEVPGVTINKVCTSAMRAVIASIEETISSVKNLKTIPAKVFITSHEAGIFVGEPGKL